jgi:tripartite-type tricarboxylate transporter receptor subunit TctC
MTRPRDAARLIAIVTALLASVAALIPRAWAAYPDRPVRIIVPFPAGGTTDIIARITGQRLSERLGQPFVVDNRSGASGNIGTQAAAVAVPDGYTLLFATPAQAINVSYYGNLPFDFIRDFAAISMVATTPNVMAVNPSVPATNLTELLTLVRAKPGQYNFGSTSPGGSPHLSGELLKIMAQVDIVHVPYRGASPMLTDLIAGQVQIGFDNLPSSLPHIKAGAIRAIAVTTAARTAIARDIPTMAESGLPGYEVSGYFGLAAPAATPPAIVELLTKQVMEIVAEPATRARLLDSGADPVGNSGADYGAFIKADVAKWARVVKDTGISAK